MLLTVQNNALALTVDTHGAQMMSLRAKDGVEYLWQGDPAYWANRAPVLFPFIGRQTNDSYQYQGKVYPMGRHGFAPASEFAVVEHTDDRLVLELNSTEQTRAQYPFGFSFRITYALEGNAVAVTYQVNNRGEETMPFAVGGHPGFRVPLLPDEAFTDYELIFSTPCRPDRIGFTPTVYVSGQETPCPLEEDVRLGLRHDLFDEDAIILKNMAREVTMRSRVSGRGVRVAYPDMPYVGFWHMPKKDAPYVCIEPWSSLPARQDVVEEITCKSDFIHLPAGKTYATTWTITLI